MNANIDDFDIDQARALLAVWTRQRDAARQKREHYERTESGLTQMISGIHAIFPDLATSAGTKPSVSDAAEDRHSAVAEQAASAGQGRPRGMTSVDVVTAVVNEDTTDTWLRVEQVAREVSRRGWAPDAEDPEAAIRTALARAAARGKIYSARLDGRTKGYRRRALRNAEDPARTGSSVTDRSSDDRSWKEGGSANGAETLHHDHGTQDADRGRDHGHRAPVVGAHES